MDIERLYVTGTDPAAAGFPGTSPRTLRTGGMVIDYDVAVPMRDAVNIYIDVYRPDNDKPVPAIVAWSAYGKHAPIGYEMLPGSGIEPDTVSQFCGFEAPDPASFCPDGFAIVYVDPRGTWGSEGDHIRWDAAEGADGYDLIEWLAGQPWCTGKIGLAGVSYLAIAQWFAAEHRPPHLAAINPWEGVSDVYREHAFHGGIPETKFVDFVQALSSRSLTRVEDLAGMRDRYPLDNEYWSGKRAQLQAIDVPAYIVASWSDHGLHTRGSIEAFKQIASEHKFLEIHGRKKWPYFYSSTSVARQKAFFARFLTDEPNEVDHWPPVRYEIRERPNLGAARSASNWPLPGLYYRRLYLDAASSGLGWDVPASATAEYDASTGSTTFDITFDRRTEVVGNISADLWVEARGSDDMDLFVGLEKLTADGRRLAWPYFSHREDGPLALGWLRVSQRALDPERSTPEQPWLTHRAEERLGPGEVVLARVEILPSGTAFDAGETLRLIVQGRDLHVYPDHPATLQHADTRNAGTHILHTGTGHPSSLLVPFLSETGPAP